MFDVIVRNLPEASVFRQIDNFLLSAFVVELQAYFQMNKELQEGGYISHMINGNQEMEVLRKEYQVMQKSLSNIIALSKQLGFDPKTRLQMIELFDDREEEEDPFANS
jgi:P27 family predicted phage terminase small subunit